MYTAHEGREIRGIYNMLVREPGEIPFGCLLSKEMQNENFVLRSWFCKGKFAEQVMGFH